MNGIATKIISANSTESKHIEDALLGGLYRRVQKRIATAKR